VLGVERAAEAVIGATSEVYKALPADWDDWTADAGKYETIWDVQEMSLAHLRAAAVELEVAARGGGDEVDAIALSEEIHYEPKLDDGLAKFFRDHFIWTDPSPDAARLRSEFGRGPPRIGGHRGPPRIGGHREGGEGGEEGGREEGGGEEGGGERGGGEEGHRGFER
jgi:hypothetical protein